MVFLKEQIRIFELKAFKRLAEKTQIVPNLNNKLVNISNRMTHSLEVGSVGKMILKRLPNELLNINENQLFNICLLHDIGHPALGHFMETILNDILKTKTNNKYFFDGNANNFIVLNKENIKLTDKTIISLIKYPYLLNNNNKGLYNFHYSKLLKKLLKQIMIQNSILCKNGIGNYCNNNRIIRKYLNYKNLNNIEIDKNLNLRTYESIIMEISDDISYSTQDLIDFLIHKSYSLNINKVYLKDYINLDKYISDDKIKTILFGLNNKNCNEIVYKIKDMFINNVYFNYSTGKIEFIDNNIEIFKSELKKLILDSFINEETIKLKEKFTKEIILNKYFKNINNNNFINKIVVSDYYKEKIINSIDKNKKNVYMVNYLAEKIDKWI